MTATPFLKMHGLGNDFVVIDARKHAIDLNEDRARHIADRRTGVGCDQLISIEPATNRLADALMRVRNADGGVVETCGNGLRCIADLLMKESGRDHVVIETRLVGAPPILVLAPTGQGDQHHAFAPRLLPDAPCRLVAV